MRSLEQYDETYSSVLPYVAYSDAVRTKRRKRLGSIYIYIYVERGWDESRLLRECERAKREKHVLNGATMIPLVMTTFGKLGPSAESYLKSLADVACSTGFVDHGVWSVSYTHLTLPTKA